METYMGLQFIGKHDDLPRLWSLTKDKNLSDEDMALILRSLKPIENPEQIGQEPPPDDYWKSRYEQERHVSRNWQIAAIMCLTATIIATIRVILFMLA